MPGEVTLAELHAVVQVGMGWTDSHLHEFEVEGVRYGIPDPDWDTEVLPEGRAPLFRIAKVGSRLRYLYDFGDGWDHDIVVEQVLAAEPEGRYPRCVAGRRACPPEDVGGPWGYEDFLAALDDPAHPEHQQWTEWIGAGFDANQFDLAEVNEALGQLAWAPLAQPSRPAPPTPGGTAGGGGSARRPRRPAR